METIIGFVVGYLVGAREGKDGVERLKTSVRSIIGSAEARRMLAEAVAVAEPIARRASSAGLAGMSGIGGTMVRQIVNRAAGTREEPRAA
jgi:hypothetical protein